MKVLILALILAVMVMSIPAMADEFDILADTFTGKNLSCPTLISTEIVKQFKDVAGKKVTYELGLKYEHSARSFVEDNSLTLTNRIIF